ncbi:MAG: hypothetical protein AAFQ94_15375 [Bacteroidota bacterium]
MKILDIKGSKSLLKKEQKSLNGGLGQFCGTCTNTGIVLNLSPLACFHSGNLYIGDQCFLCG